MTNKRRFTISVLCLLMLIVSMFAISACGGKVENFNLSFKVDGESYSTISTNGSEVVAIPENPTKEGYTFDGWYWDKDVWSKPFTANSLMDAPISSDMSVYAKFSSIKYDITYENDGGTHSNPVSYTIEDSFALSAAEKIGYTFIGWYSDSVYTSKVESVSAGSTGAIILYAKFEINNYTISYGNTMDVPNNNVTNYNVNTDTITLSDLSKTGYVFEGWYNGEEKVTEIVKGSTGDITLTAKWSVIGYEITYHNVDGATNSNSVTYDVEDQPLILDDASKKGYRFLGWYTDAAFTNKVSEIAIGTTGDINLYAKWEVVEYTITFLYDNAIGDYAEGTVVKTTYTVEDEFEFATLVCKTAGYTFNGWFTEKNVGTGTKVTGVTKGTSGNITVYAQFGLEEYDITYNNVNGATNNNPTHYNIDSEEFTIYPLTKAGYTFNGWFTDEDCTTPANLTILKGSHGDITLYAKWTPLFSQIIYDYQEGASVISDFDSMIYFDSNYILDLPYREGFLFAGWYTEPNGNGEQLSDELGYSIKAWDKEVETIIVYAKWTEEIHYVIEHEDESIILDCENDIEFLVASEYVITEHNIADYVIVKDKYGESVTIEIAETEDEGVYKIYKKDGYVSGDSYTITLMENVYFYEKDSTLTSIYFTIKDVEKMNYEYADGYTDATNIISLSTNEILDFCTDGFFIEKSEDYQVGQIIAISHSSELLLEEEGLYVEITKVSNMCDYTYIEVSEIIDAEKVLDYYLEHGIKVILFDNIKDVIFLSSSCSIEEGDAIEIYDELELTSTFVIAKKINTFNQDTIMIELNNALGNIYETLDINCVSDVVFTDDVIASIDKDALIEEIMQTESYRQFVYVAYSMERSIVDFIDTIDDLRPTVTISNQGGNLQISVTFSHTFKDVFDSGEDLEFKVEFTLSNEVSTKQSAEFYHVFGGWEIVYETIQDIETGVKVSVTVLGSSNEPGKTEILAKRRISQLLETYKEDRGASLTYLSDYLDAEGYNNFAYDWGSYFRGNKTLANNKISRSITLMSVPVGPIMQVRIELEVFLELDWNIDGFISVTHHTRNVDGVRTVGFRRESYSSHTGSTYLSVCADGKLLVETGVRLKSYLTIKGAARYLQVGVAGEVGLYAEFKGILIISSYEILGSGSDDDYHGNMAAKLELGWYWRAGFYGKLWIFQGYFAKYEEKHPLVEVGNDSVVLGFDSYEDLNIADLSVEIKDTDICDIEIFDLNKLVKKVKNIDAKNFDFSFKDGRYLKVEDGKIIVLADSPASFSDELTVRYTVSSRDGRYISKTIKINYAGPDAPKHTITFIDAQGERTISVFDGWSLTSNLIPKIRSKTGYTQTPPIWDISDCSNITSDFTVNAIYTPNVYTVEFYVDGELYQQEKVTHGNDLLNIPTIPTKIGYNLAEPYWNYRDFTNIKKNIVVKAVYIPNQQTITFNANGGTPVEDIIGNYGTNITYSPITTRVGYLFDGWYTSLSFKGEKVVFPYKIGLGTTLYAKWIPISYTVTFMPNGGIGEMNPQVHVYNSNKNLSKNAFVKEGYSFVGWSQIPQNGDILYKNRQNVLNLSTVQNDNIVLYAVWKANNYTIAFDANGGIGSIDSIATEYDQEVNLPQNIFTREGYIFSGWTTSAMGSLKYFDGDTVSNLTSKNNATVTLFAKWIPIQYCIVFNGNGADAGSMDAQWFEYGKPQNISKNQFSKEGYMLEGWSTSSDGEVVYLDEQEISNLTTKNGEQIKLFAIWTPITYSVKFHGNGASSGEMSSQAFKYDAGQTLKANVFEKTGYTFEGWSLTSDGDIIYANNEYVINLTDKQNEIINLYAQWVPITYTIEFIANGGSGTMSSQTFVYDATERLNENLFEKLRYIFVGWATSPSGDVEYDDTQYVSNLATQQDAVVKLYAKWEPITYYIKYHSNGATSGTMPIQTLTADLSQSLFENEFSRIGYDFIGWSISVNGEVEYLDKAKVINLADTQGEIINLYAVWQAKEYTVTLISENGVEILLDYNDETGTIESYEVTVASRLVYPSIPTREGYVFGGWYTNELCTGTPYDFTATIDETITLYAKWLQPSAYQTIIDVGGNTGSITYNANTGTIKYYAFVPLVSQTIKVGAQTFTSGTDYYARLYDSNKAQLKSVNIYSSGTQTFTYDVTAGTLYYIGVIGYYSNSGICNVKVEGTMLPCAGGKVEIASVNYSTETVTFGQAFTFGVPQKDFYMFEGWYDGEKGTGTRYTNSNGEGMFNWNKANDTILYAKWKTMHYKVSFDANGGIGEAIAPIEFDRGVKTSLPYNTFSKVGYTFNGWALSPTGDVYCKDGQTISTFTNAESSEVILYAVWSPITYSIQFNGNGHTVGAIPNQTITYDVETPLSSNTFEKAACTFKGWSLSENGSVDYSDGDVVINLSETKGDVIVLYAVWEQAPFVIAFDANGGTGTMYEQGFDFGIPQQIKANSFTRAGYTFVGWATSSTGEVEYIDKQSVSNLSITLYAVWSPNEYIVTLNKQSGSGGSDAFEIVYDSALPSGLTPPTRTGYVFAGYYDASSGGTMYFNSEMQGQRNWNKASNTTLYARWTAITYTVRFNKNGGSGSMSNQTMTYGSSQSLRSNSFSRSGYVFLGWATTSNGAVTYTNAQSVKNLKTTQGAVLDLYAVWGYRVTAKVDTTGGGVVRVGTGSSGTNVSNTIKAGNSITLTAIPNTNYAFAGWYLENSTTTLSTSTSYTIYPNDSRTYVAVFYYALETSTGLEFTAIGTTAYKVTGYTGTESNVVIPAYYNGKPVTEIGNKAFYQNKVIQSITIPYTITSIGDDVFCDSPSFTNFSVAGNNPGLKAIDGILFSYDGKTILSYPASKSGTSYRIPYGVERIRDCTFHGCINLETIIFPSSVTYLEQHVLHTMSKIKELRFESSVPPTMSASSSNTFYSTSQLFDITVPYGSCCSSTTSTCALSNGSTYCYKHATNWSSVRTQINRSESYLYLNSTYNINISTAGQQCYYYFTPSITGTYVIESSGSVDSYVVLYDEYFKQITYNDDGGDGKNFKLSYTLTAGKKYYICVKMYSSSATGTFTFNVSKTT